MKIRGGGKAGTEASMWISGVPMRAVTLFEALAAAAAGLTDRPREAKP